MLSGRYPSDEFAELRPRLVWDRLAGTLSARPGAQRLAVTSGGTIPDRGLFGVFLMDGQEAGGRRVGELDEEMVYESRVGDVIALGASSWRIEDITHDRVLVTPAPGQPGRLPFWHGDAIGRPAELGRAVGGFVREVAARGRSALDGLGLDAWATENLLAYVDEQRRSTGLVPDDTTIVVERFRDELGDWRVVIHSPWGARVHAPWALALGARIRESIGIDAHVMHADDGIVMRLPDTDDEDAARSVTQLLAIDPADIDAMVTSEVGGSALFASRFRECAARALLLPRRRPDRRTPLWQQRQRSAHLLDVASGYASFPIILETVRECLQDVYDVPALIDLMAQVADGRIRVHETSTEHPSPFAQSLLFGYVASFLYEGDSPLAERRAQALTLDTGLLAELLGTPELRDLLDAEAVDEVEAELQRLTERTRAHDLEDAADLLRLLGPLSAAAAADRGIEPAWLAELVDRRRAIRVRVAGAECVAAVEDAGRLRDALGVALPVGIAEAHLAVVADPLGDVVRRFARTHGPFTPGDVARALGLAPAVATEVLDRLAAGGTLLRGEFRPGGSHTEYCDAEVLRRIRRRSIAKLRHQIEPVPAARFAAFLPEWQHVASVGARPGLRGLDGCYEVIEQLAGTALPASTWLRAILPARVEGAHDAMIDQLIASGDVTWWGISRLPGGDGVVALAPADRADMLRSDSLALARGTQTGSADSAERKDGAEEVLAALADGGALFFRDLADRVGVGSAASTLASDTDLVELLWDLVWAGEVTNDGWAALRARIDGRSTGSPRRAGGGRPRLGGRGRALGGLPQRSGPASAAGRWSLLAPSVVDPALAAQVLGDGLLERYGVVTRGSVVAERIPGGFASAYRVLTAFEDAGRCRRTYAVEGLGAAQFAVPAAVDRLRAGGRRDGSPTAWVLAATDPAQAYGAALPWPPAAVDGAHRPGRKAGAVVVLVEGDLVAYLERGGRSLLLWDAPTDDYSDGPADGDATVVALRALAGAGPLIGADRAVITRINGSAVQDRHATALSAAGFLPTPRGWRMPRSHA